MSAELITFLFTVGGMLVTALGFWLRSVIPGWFKNKQNQENRKLDAEIDIKRISVNEEFKKDGALYKAYLDSITSMASLVKVCENLASNVDKGFTNLAETAISDKNFLELKIDKSAEDIKNCIKLQLDQHTATLLNELKDQKIKELTQTIERIEKAPESRLKPS